MTILKELSQCVRCPDLVATRQNVVMAEGTCPTDILFLTNSPKDREDTQGRPLAGMSGKYLRATTNSIFSSRFRLAYLCTILCKTPKREASDQEITNCRSNIMKQLELFKPKIVIAMGKTAQAFVHNCPLKETAHSSVGTLASLIINDKPVPVIITFDPQQVLKDRLQLETIFVRHLQAATKLMFSLQ